MISIKDRDVLKGMLVVAFHPTLIRVLRWADETWPDLLTITSAYRAGDLGSLHATNPCRAIDIRSWVFKDPYLVMRKINEVWVYDPHRLYMNVAILHNVGSGWHFHIQVHPNTRRREE